MLFLLLSITQLALAQTAGCGKNKISNGKHSLGSREYWIHFPTGYNKDVPTPVVTLFHGWGYSGKEWYSGSGWGAVSAAPTADKEGFILVSPTGVTDSSLRGNCDNGMGYCSWNGAGTSQSPGPLGATCNPNVQRDNYCYSDTCGNCADICSWTSCTDDVAFVHSLLDNIEDLACVDKSRVYAGGESNGAVFTWELGSSPGAARFAALAPWNGLPHRGFARNPTVTPLPILGTFGWNDRTIPPGNNVDEYTQSVDGWYYTTARTTTKQWAQAHGCKTSGNPNPYPTKHDGHAGLTCTSYDEGCVNAPVVDCRYGGNHDVLGITPAFMWEFLSKHSRVNDTIVLTK